MRGIVSKPTIRLFPTPKPRPAPDLHISGSTGRKDRGKTRKKDGCFEEPIGRGNAKLTGWERKYIYMALIGKRARGSFGCCRQ